jgi:hypothetical protein
MGRMGKAEELVAAGMFLCPDEARFITGNTPLLSTGGFSPSSSNKEAVWSTSVTFPSGASLGAKQEGLVSWLVVERRGGPHPSPPPEGEGINGKPALDLEGELPGALTAVVGGSAMATVSRSV